MIVRVALAGVAALCLAVAAPAGAQVPDDVATGLTCGMTDLAVSPEAVLAEIDGGPLVATAPGASVSMTCTLQLDDDRLHSDPDVVAVSSAPAVQVAVVPPTLVTYRPGTWVILCTQVVVDGVTYYLDGVEGGWSTDAATECTLFSATEFDDPGVDAVGELADGVLGGALDAILCPILRSLSPYAPFTVTSDGDVYYIFRIWDCA